MTTKDYSRILLSIFKRKGGEGVKTKIIDDSNRSMLISVFPPIEESEKALVAYVNDRLNGVLLTNKGVLITNDGRSEHVYYADLNQVDPAFQVEFSEGVTSKNSFTKLKLKDKNNLEYVIELEKGLPYQGIFQMLHFIIGK